MTKNSFDFVESGFKRILSFEFMKKLIVLFAALWLVSGCSKNESSNPAGASFAKSKTPPLVTYSKTVLFTPGLGLMRDTTLLESRSWGTSGPCRIGFFHKNPFYGYLEFKTVSLPADFKNAYAPFQNSASEVGIDSICITLHFQTSSQLSSDTLRPRLSFYSGKKVVSVGSDSVKSYRMDSSSLQLLTTLQISKPLIGTDDSGIVTLKLSDSTKPLFRYLLDKMAGPKSDSTIPFVIGSSDTTVLYTLKANSAPRLTYFGHRRQAYTILRQDSIIDTLYGNTWVHDSATTKLLFLNYASFPTASRITGQAAVGTIFNQFEKETLSGYYQSEFFLNKDSLFQNLIPDSINILKARVIFFAEKNPLITFSENQTAVNLNISCQFISQSGASVDGTGNVILRNFSPATDDSIVYSIDELFLSRLTNPENATVNKIVFTISPYDYDVDRMAQVVFQRKIAIQYEYSKR